MDGFLAVHTATRSRTHLTCGRCHAPVGSLSIHLDLLCGDVTRKSLRNDNTAAILWSDDGTQSYCSDGCRNAHRPAHSLICTGGLPSGAPLRELQILASRQPTEALSLAVSLIATAAADACSRDPSDCTAAPLAWLEQCADDGVVSPSSSVWLRMAGGDDDDDDEDDERASDLEEAFALLRVGLLERLPSSHAERLGSSELLERPFLFERLVRTIERRILPLALESPLVAVCKQLGRPGDVPVPDLDESRPRALKRLLRAVRLLWPSKLRGKAHGEEEDATTQLDALLAREASEAAAEEETEEAAEAEVTDARLVTLQRRACLLAQCAPRLFPPIPLAAFATSTLRIPHSCAPNSQLQRLPRSATVDAATLPPLLSAGPVALRPRLNNDEGLSVSWVDVSKADVNQRQAALRSRFGPDFVCDCMRCQYERPCGSADWPLVMLARDAMEDGRHSEAVVMLRRRVHLEPSDGDAWMLLGTALLNSERWTAAHTAWKKGGEMVPAHPLLSRQRCKDERYHAEANNAAASSSLTPAECHTHLLPGGGPGCKVAVTAQPLFTPSECEGLIQAAERYAASIGGWTTARHHAVPTTDIPIHEAPELLSWFKDAMASRLQPMLASQFEMVGKRGGGEKVRVHDAFLVRYTAGAQAHLPLHTDESMISLTIVLNGAFAGGGTYFADLRRALSPPVGHVIAFDGRALHGGEPIVRGTRYIVAAFLYVEEEEEAGEEVEKRKPALEGVFAQHKRAKSDAATSGGGGGGGGGGFAFNFG